MRTWLLLKDKVGRSKLDSSAASGRTERDGAEATSRAWYDNRLEGAESGTEEGKFMARCSRSGLGHDPWLSASLPFTKAGLTGTECLPAPSHPLTYASAAILVEKVLKRGSG